MTADDPLQMLPGEAAASRLSARVRLVGVGVIRVKVTGEIDMTNAADFAVELRQAVATRPECLEVDLSDVTFFGCAGVHALLAAHRSTPRLVVIAVPQAARRLMTIAGLPVS
jgi:anti-sigma B factor antagonist